MRFRRHPIWRRLARRLDRAKFAVRQNLASGKGDWRNASISLTIVWQPPSKAISLPIRMIALESEANAIAIARGLLDCGVYTLVTFFPTAGQQKAGIRVCITAEHKVRDIERLCDCTLENVAETTGKPYPLR